MPNALLDREKGEIKMKPKILVMGSFNMDITGYALRLPKNGETVMGERYAMSPGGKGSNQAVAASRAGGDVTMIARMGKDAFGEIGLKTLSGEGISEKHLILDSQASTGFALIEVDGETGENRIIVIPGANQKITKEQIDAAADDIQDCDCVLAQLETNLDAVQAFFDCAKKNRKPVILNPAPFRSLPDGFLSGLDVFTPNETEAEYFSGIAIHSEADARRAALEFMKMGVRTVVITLGKAGAYYMNENEDDFVSAPSVKAIDTTGAGDAFTGALSVALGEKRSLREAVQFAVCFASLSVTKPGAAASMPYRNEAEAFMKTVF